MSWSIGFDSHWNRDIGYGVPAFCDHPRCKAEIDRGLAYVCGGEPYGGDKGCGLYFCAEHLLGVQCSRCRDSKRPFAAKPDHPTWMHHKLMDASWAAWRIENPEEALALSRAYDAVARTPERTVDAPRATSDSSSSSKAHL